MITPLVLADGTAVLVDRGWIPAAAGDAATAPVVPAAPSGEVTVVGRVHAPESRATTPEPFGGRLAVRRIGPEQLARSMPYPLYGAYLTLEQQTPPADPAFEPIPPDHENAAHERGIRRPVVGVRPTHARRLRLSGLPRGAPTVH